MSTTDHSIDPGSAAGTDEGPTGTKDSAGAKEQAQQAAGTAKDEGQRVAGVAKGEARRVTDEAATQVRGLVDDATSQLDEQSRTQKARLAETVRTFGQDLDSMKTNDDGSGGLAGQVVQQVAEQAHSLASHLEDRDPRDLLEDVRGFARRKPGAFLLGALAAGVVVGRLTRGAKAAHDDPSPSGSASPTTPRPVTVGNLPSAQPDDHHSGTRAPTQTDLGAKGVEMSETGVVGQHGGRA